MKPGDRRDLIPASGYIEHDDGRVITMQFGDCDTKQQAKERCQQICDALNWIAGHGVDKPGED